MSSFRQEQGAKKKQALVSSTASKSWLMDCLLRLCKDEVLYKTENKMDKRPSFSTAVTEVLFLCTCTAQLRNCFATKQHTQNPFKSFD